MKEEKWVTTKKLVNADLSYSTVLILLYSSVSVVTQLWTGEGQDF